MIRNLILPFLICAAIVAQPDSEGAESPGPRDVHSLGKTFIFSPGAKTGSPRIDSLLSDRGTGLMATKLADADPCTVFVDYPSYALYDWMIGWELYESYMDLTFPLVECDTTYPFMVTDVGMTLALNAAGSLFVQAFVAELDPLNSTPECPYPGAIVGTTEVFPGYISEPGVYMLGVDFANPVPVYGPFFAGVFYACDMTIFDPGIAIDSVAYYCLDYNDWGEGLVDLASNPWYPFPGSIDLFCVGYNGSDAEPASPEPHFLLPDSGGSFSPGDPIWIAELTDTLLCDGTVIEYWDNTEWVPFGIDFDGDVPLRDGLVEVDTADGWLPPWNPSVLVEDELQLRAAIVCPDSVYASDTTVARFAQSPPRVEFDFNQFDTLCDSDTASLTVVSVSPDSVTFAYRFLSSVASRNWPLLDRADYGDSDGDPADGNHYYEGEFGEYYAAPSVFAAALSYWSTAGFADLLWDTDSTLTIEQLVELLAEQARVRDNLGSEDDNVCHAIGSYVSDHADGLIVDIRLNPDWNWLLQTHVARRATVALAVDQPVGHWLGLQMIEVGQGAPDSVPVTLFDPDGATLQQSYLRSYGDSVAVGYWPAASKRRLPLAVAIYPADDTATTIRWQSDWYGLDGYTATLPTSELAAGENYLLIADAYANDAVVASDYRMIHYICSSDWIRGDADNNGSVNVSDVVFLIQYVFATGDPPQPELAVGDVDCSGAVNVSDIVYLISYVFADGPPPCE
jgi:hypothetical protein